MFIVLTSNQLSSFRFFVFVSVNVSSSFRFIFSCNFLSFYLLFFFCFIVSFIKITMFFLFLLYLQVLPNDGLPTIVCNMCRTQLDTCQQFRDKAQRSQQKLQNFLQFANKLTGNPQVRSNCFSTYHFYKCN